MGPFEIAAIAIVGGCAIEFFRIYTKRQNEKSAKANPAMKEEIDALKARVAALETLVTDKSYQLREEFKKL